MDRYNFQSQLEHLQSKYIGTGHSDTTKFEWLVNQHRYVSHSYSYFLIFSSYSLISPSYYLLIFRYLLMKSRLFTRLFFRDSFASYIGHYGLMDYFGLVENESKARVTFNLLEKMLQPCGPPPEKPEWM